MGATLRGLLGGGQRVAEHDVPLAGGVGVMGDPRRVGFLLIEERLEDAPVQLGPSGGQDRGGHGQPGELVAERELAAAVDSEHAGRHALVDVLGRRLRDGFEELALDGSRHHGGDVEHPTCPLAQAAVARQHGIADVVGQCGVGVGEHLGHEEGVATGPGVEFGRVEPGVRRELGDRVEAERGERVPRHGRKGGEIAQHGAERMRGSDLVRPVGGEHRGVGTADAAAEEPQQVKRRGIGPVHVLEHGDGGTAGSGQLGEEAHEQLVSGLALEQRPDLAARLRHVGEGSERTGRREVVAGAHEDPQRRAALLHDGVDDGGLADTGFPGDEGQAAVSRDRLIQRRVEGGEDRIALDDKHPSPPTGRGRGRSRRTPHRRDRGR